MCGLDWIAAQRDPVDPSRPMIEAVNMSVAKHGGDDGNCGYTVKDLMHRAICRVVDAGITVVAAAGNDRFNANNLKPASYNEVITVSALADTDGRPGGLGGALCYSWSSYDQDDTFADFSNYGGDVDLIAPGKCIWSTVPGNGYAYISGTSMAAPHVTGAAALFKASRPDATPSQVKAALRAAGTQDWKTSTDPDSVHEPLLDVSHLVNLGDFTIDATPGTSRSALVSGEGASLELPLQVFRAEDFPGAIDLEITTDAPLDRHARRRAAGGPGRDRHGDGGDGPAGHGQRRLRAPGHRLGRVARAPLDLPDHGRRQPALGRDAGPPAPQRRDPRRRAHACSGPGPPRATRAARSPGTRRAGASTGSWATSAR